MTYIELIGKALAVVHKPEQSTFEDFDKTVNSLPVTDSELDLLLYPGLVDMAVEEYVEKRVKA